STTPRSQDWSDKGGKCMGYARRFPTGKAFGSPRLGRPPATTSRSTRTPTLPSLLQPQGRCEPGSDETRANPPAKAYGGKYGRMTVTSVGDTLCVRWPAKNHAAKNEPNGMVQINLSKVRNGADISQQELLKNTIARLPYKNCMAGSNQDRRACGGCFKVPVRASGIYLLQW
ncbi:MAG: hypothetical protein BYD32DRAFT_405972, partial [Podila humilis]